MGQICLLNAICENKILAKIFKFTLSLNNHYMKGRLNLEKFLSEGQEEAGAGTTPGTAPISLDALFRTASLQQGPTLNPSAPNKPPAVQR